METDDLPERSTPRFARIDILLFGLLMLLIVRAWFMVAPSSLWVDELVTLFVIRNPEHPSFAVAPQVPASVYFWLPKMFVRFLGTSEFTLRLPSMLAMGAALWFIARLAARLIHPNAKWFAVFACLAANSFNFFAIDARPYALGIALSSMSVYFLVRWFDSARWSDALYFAFSAALLWRVHLFYWPFYLVYAAYVLIRIGQGNTRVRVWQVLLAAVGISVSLWPVVLTAIKVHDDAGSHVFNDPPTLLEFLIVTQMILIPVCGGLAWLLKILLKEKTSESQLDSSGLALILFWWLVCPVCLTAYSWLSHNGVLIPRYVSLMLPGLGLAATAATAYFLPAQYWKKAAVAAAAAVLALSVNWTVLWPWHEGEGWKEAAKLETELATDATPVLCPSPFIEAQPPAWKPDYRLPGFLYAHLSYYPLRGQASVFPFVESPEADRFAADLLHSKLIPSKRFILYGPLWGVEYLYGYLARQPELLAWHSQVHQFGAALVVVYSATPISNF